MFQEVNIWCEDNVYIIKNPVNTISNVFYLISAYFIQKNDFNLGIFTFFTSITSGLYHNSNIVFFQIFDFTGIYLIVLTIIYNYTNYHIDFYFLSINIFLNVITVITLNSSTFKFTPQLITILLIFYILYLEKKKYKSLSLKFKFSMIFLITGFTFSIVDAFKIYCVPTSFIQFHSLWHLFSSVSIYLIHTRFNYFISKNVHNIPRI